MRPRVATTGHLDDSGGSNGIRRLAWAVWISQPDLRTAASAWILRGGAHHTGFSQPVTREHLEDFAQMADVQFLLIDTDTRLTHFKKELRWNEVYYRMSTS